MFTFQQKFKRSTQIISFILLFGLLLSACQSNTPEPETEPEPTEVTEQIDEVVPTETPAPEEPTTAPTEPPVEVPTEVPTEEPTEEPQADAEGTIYESAVEGYAIVIPEEFKVMQDGTDVIIPEFEDDPDAYLLFSTGADTGDSDMLTFLTGMAGDIVGDSGTIDEPAPISINGADGHSISFETEEDGATIKGVFLALETDTNKAVMFGGGSSDYWDSSLEAVFNQIANSIVLTEPNAAAAENTTGEEAGEEASVAAVSATGISGVACMAGKNVGISCLNPDGSWSFFNNENSSLSSNFISAMTACANNQIVISASSDLNLFDGSTFEVIPGDWGYSSPDEIACDGSGNIWVIFFDGAGFYDGAAWTTFEFSDFSNDDSGLVSDVAISDDGTAWVLASNSISAYKDGSWTIYEEGNGLDDQYFFNHLGIGANGQPIASYGDGFVIFDGAGWIETEADSYYGLQDLTSSADSVWFETLSEGLVQFNGASFNVVDRSSGLSSNVVNGTVVDSSGRLWVGTDYGINIITADGVQTFNMANSDIADQRVEHLVVLGDGPQLPAIIEKGTGSISGSVKFEDGTPLADARVELCAEGLTFGFTNTPCAEQALFYQTTTDADGSFMIDGVEVGYYVTVIEAKADEWAQVVGEFGFLAERLLISEGETTEIGEITITQDE